MRERDIIKKGNLAGYYDEKGNFVVVAEYGLTDADLDRYAAQVQNGEGYYNADGRYVKYHDYDNEDEYY